MSKNVPERDDRDGFVLIAVLSVLALLSGLVVAMLLLSRTSVDSAILATADLETEAMMQSGISLAAYELFILKLPFERVSGQQIRVDQGVITFTVSSDSGKADINAANRDILIAAYRASGLTSLTPDDFAGRVMDWRDQDEEISENGAEAGDYASAGLEYGPRNSPFRFIDDLQWVMGVSASDVAALRGLVTVYNPRGRLDTYSAAPSLIAALPRMIPEIADEVVKLRKVRNAVNKAKLDDLLLVQSSMIDTERPNTYRVTMLIMPGRGNRPRQAEVVLTAGVNADVPYHILRWTE